MLRLGLAVSVSIFLTACNAPRGGAIQSEILAEANAKAPDIALYQVDRSTLAKYRAWPSTNDSDGYGWLKHKHQGPDAAITPGDSLNIVIWDSEETSLLSNGTSTSTVMKDLKVSSSGTIFLPFAGTVRVAGLSENGARNIIQRKMSEVVPSAQVQLSASKGTNASVSIVAGVAKPGSYPINDGHFTVLNALAAAGGPNARISNPQLRLVRSGKVYTESLATLLEDADQDTVLRGGDKLSIESDRRYFRSLGAATKEAIIPFDRPQITALDAMSMIGGLDARSADPKGIMVLRQYKPTQVRDDGTGPANDRAVFVFDITSADGMFSAGEFNIQSKDTVLVTESSLNSANYTLGVLLRLTGAAEDLNALR